MSRSRRRLLPRGFASAASADHPQREGAVRPAFTQVQRVDGTIVDVAAGNPAFSTLVTALQAADLVTTLQGPGPFTVFAPTNEAFAAVQLARASTTPSRPSVVRRFGAGQMVVARRERVSTALNLLRQHGVVQYSSCGRLIVDVSALKN